MGVDKFSILGQMNMDRAHMRARKDGRGKLPAKISKHLKFQRLKICRNISPQVRFSSCSASVPCRECGTKQGVQCTQAVRYKITFVQIAADSS